MQKKTHYFIHAVIPFMFCACTMSPESQSSLAHAQQLIAETYNDPKIAAALRDWNGPDRRISIPQIQTLRAGIDTRAVVEKTLGQPTKIVYKGTDETWNYQHQSKGLSIWGNAVTPRLFEPSRDYIIRASFTIRAGVLLAYWWSTDVNQLDVMHAQVGIPFNEKQCQALQNGISIDETLKLVGEPTKRTWLSNGEHELGYLYGHNGKSTVANLRFVSGKLQAKNIVTYP